MKNQKGITLVALVITIIVLLILAGVSISLVIGNNGVLTQASSSVITNNIAQVKEDLTMALSACEATYYTEWTQEPSTTRSDVYEGVTKNPIVNTDGAFIDELSGKYFVKVTATNPVPEDADAAHPVVAVDANEVVKLSLVKDTNTPVYVVLTKNTTSTNKETYVFTLDNGVSEATGSYTIGASVTYQATGQDPETKNI